MCRCTMKQPYHVVPRDEDDRRGDWAVKRGGANRAASTHTSKNRAIKEGKKLARKQRRGLIVHRADGTTQYGYQCDTSGSRAKLVKSN